MRRSPSKGSTIKPRFLNEKEAARLERKRLGKLTDVEALALEWKRRGLSLEQIVQEMEFGKERYRLWVGRTRLEIARRKLYKHAEKFFGKFSPQTPEGFLITLCIDAQISEANVKTGFEIFLKREGTTKRARQIATRLRRFAAELREREHQKNYSNWMGNQEPIGNVILKKAEALEKEINEERAKRN